MGVIPGTTESQAREPPDGSPPTPADSPFSPQGRVA